MIPQQGAVQVRAGHFTLLFIIRAAFLLAMTLLVLFLTGKLSLALIWSITFLVSLKLNEMLLRKRVTRTAIDKPVWLLIAGSIVAMLLLVGGLSVATGLRPAMGGLIALLLAVLLVIQSLYLLPRLRMANTLLFLLACCALLTVEGLVRAGGLEVYAQPQGVPRSMIRDSRLGWITPNLDDVFNFQEASSMGIGQRLQSDAQDSQKLVLCLGGSSTAGQRNADADDNRWWPEELQDVFAADGEQVKVLNAGASGYASFQILVLFKEFLTAVRPDLVIVYSGFNDFCQAQSAPMTQREWFELSRRAQNGQAGGWIVSLQRLLSHSHLYNLAVRAAMVGRAKLGDARANSPVEFKHNLIELCQEIHSRGGRALFVAEASPTVPPEYGEQMVSAAAECDALFLDIQPRLLQGHQWGELFSDDVHTTPFGAQIIAQVMADFIDEQNLITQ
ncbi:MAG: SGNH/GDSL hydrolase family protein [Candidatus Alcyoniella australis]|nr:SGNH/GDSL hydrolase family protein [Candidatus Alcyoniella australis]